MPESRPSHRGIEKAFAGLSKIIGLLQACALISIIVLVLTSITLRNFFDYGLVWVFEASGFLMVSMVFLGIPKNLFNNDDISVDFVTSRLGTMLRRLAWLFQQFVIAAVLTIFVVSLLRHGMKFGLLQTPTLGIPHWLFYSSVVIGPALGALFILWNVVLGQRGRPKG